MQANRNEITTFNAVRAAVLREQNAVGEVEVDSFTSLSAGDHPPSVTRTTRAAIGAASLTVRLAGDEMSSTVNIENGRPINAHAANEVRPDFRSLVDTAKDAGLF